jgi:hypothetical protein
MALFNTVLPLNENVVGKPLFVLAFYVRVLINPVRAKQVNPKKTATLKQW